ncbi:hypothetical protein B4U79_01979 [Dinothrombium tinctorium]|nr:hypothetical protein B4U79_00611 [Dinothrombium tinctorium]RWS16874.1 hypothetical protein B4U79_01979 [Dinothrombium tinctorium]
MKKKPSLVTEKLKKVECVFCRSNGEEASFYSSHSLKDKNGKVQCPILFNYNCPICNNGGGPNAHTIKYCPMNTGAAKVISIVDKIKKGRKSNGRKRN